jgi:hypothetical protein
MVIKDRVAVLAAGWRPGYAFGDEAGEPRRKEPRRGHHHSTAAARPPRLGRTAWSAMSAGWPTITRSRRTTRCAEFRDAFGVNDGISIEDEAGSMSWELARLLVPADPRIGNGSGAMRGLPGTATSPAPSLALALSGFGPRMLCGSRSSRSRRRTARRCPRCLSHLRPLCRGWVRDHLRHGSPFRGLPLGASTLAMTSLLRLLWQSRMAASWHRARAARHRPP